MPYSEFTADFFASENLFGHLTYILAILSMIMRTMHWLRFFAVLSGLVALIYFGIVRADYVSAFWEFFYVAVNLVQLFILWYENRIGQFDEVQREFVTRALMGLRPVHAARLLRQARLETVPENRVIVEEGSVPDRLYYVVSGDVRIAQNGVEVGMCGHGDFLGEMSLISGGAANATAATVTPCHMIVFDRPTLEARLAKTEPIRHALQAGISRNLLAKIGRMNAYSVNMRSA